MAQDANAHDRETGSSAFAVLAAILARLRNTLRTQIRQRGRIGLRRTRQFQLLGRFAGQCWDLSCAAPRL